MLKFNYTVIQLNQLKWQDYLDRPNPIASALMAKMQIEPEDRARVKLECLKMLIGLGLDPARTQLLSGFVGSYLHLNTEEEAEFETGLNALNPQDKESTMEIVTDWTLRGREQGKAMGASDITLRASRRKFGQISPELEGQILALPLDKSEQLIEDLFGFSEVGELEAWLKEAQAQPQKS